jgi:hypothetical protein
MEIIVPLTITEEMITSSNVAEDDYEEWTDVGTEMYPFNTSPLDWTGISIDSLTADVYACSATEIKWSGITIDENAKTVYSCVKGGDVYFRALGDSYFNALGQTVRDWSGIAVDSSNGNLYACVYGGGIYKRVGADDFIEVDASIRNWAGVTIDSATNDVWACVFGGFIYKQTAGAGAFNAITATPLNWSGITIDPITKDIYACVNGGDIYKQTGGLGDFVAMGQTSRAWSGISVNSDTGDIYACVARVGLFIYGTTVYNTGNRVISTADHSIYESLVDSNVRKNPITDSVSSNPSWARVGTTNKWKMFDYKVSSQTIVARNITSVITPGVKISAISLIEVEATQVIVTTENPTTTRVVDITDEITDLVIKDLAADDIIIDNSLISDLDDMLISELDETVIGDTAAWNESTVFTITIINSSSPAKCGELIMGVPQDLGFTQYGVDLGILDYSVKETDSFGTPKLIVREFAKKGNFDVLVDQVNLNSVYRKLAKYRATNVLWIGDDNIAPTIIFGWCRKFNIVLPQLNVNICSLEIEGMT